MAVRLTDTKKKKIIADYVETGTYTAAGRMNGVSDKTVKSVVMNNLETLRIFEQIKEQNTTDMLAYMESRKVQAQGIIDSYLKALANPGKIKAATPSEIATALSIVVDKFTKHISVNTDKMNDIIMKMETLAEKIKEPVPNREIEDLE